MIIFVRSRQHFGVMVQLANLIILSRELRSDGSTIPRPAGMEKRLHIVPTTSLPCIGASSCASLVNFKSIHPCASHCFHIGSDDCLILPD